MGPAGARWRRARGERMPLYTADALVLRTYKLGEADRIVVFLTADRGKRRGVARGARRPRSRFSGGLEPLTRVRTTYFEHERRDLVRLRDVEPVSSPLTRGGAEALLYVSYFAELIDEWAPEADPNDRLFRLGAAVAEALTGDAPVERLARYFEYWLLRLQGVYPSLAECRRCGGDLSGGGAARLAPRLEGLLCTQCAAPAEGAPLSAGALAFLRVAGTVPPGGLSGVALPTRAGRELEAAHRRLLAAHLDKELKSARVVRELAAAYGGSRAGASDP